MKAEDRIKIILRYKEDRTDSPDDRIPTILPLLLLGMDSCDLIQRLVRTIVHLDHPFGSFIWIKHFDRT